jgi:hypothetical protein
MRAGKFRLAIFHCLIIKSNFSLPRRVLELGQFRPTGTTLITPLNVSAVAVPEKMKKAVEAVVGPTPKPRMSLSVPGQRSIILLAPVELRAAQVAQILGSMVPLA